MSIYRDRISSKLTESDIERARQMEDTFPGQAHFAHTGPSGFTCRECIHWGHSGPSRGYGAGGLIKPAICRKARELTVGRRVVLKAVPDSAFACQHFKFNPDAPRRIK